MEKVDKIKRIMLWIIIFLYINNGCVKSPNALTFENVKKEYKKGGFQSIELPSGNVFYMKQIFDLPENKQQKAWDTFTNSVGKDARSTMKKEVKILQAAKNKDSSQYSEYIRTDAEIEQHLADILRRRRSDKISQKSY